MNDLRQFRRCLGKFATGVTVVTCADRAGKPYGITANSFSSVSLEPPLILWNIARVSNSLTAFLNAEHFAINVLASGQRDVSKHFARSDHTLFDSVEYSRSASGAPLLPGSLATFECRTFDVHECGDHYIVIGEVVEFSAGDGEPLLFFGGDYRALAAAT